MLNENFVIVGAIIAGLGSLSYLIDTVKGKIQPNRVTFFFWSLAPLVAFAAEIKEGVGIQSLLTFMVGFTPLLILIASFANKKSYWKLGSFDYICGILSFLGLTLWYITGKGNIAIFFSILADILAALPTYVKSYHHPETENSWGYSTAAINAIITVLTIKKWNFGYYAFPIYTICLDLSLFALIQFKLGKKLSKLL